MKNSLTAFASLAALGLSILAGYWVGYVGLLFGGIGGGILAFFMGMMVTFGTVCTIGEKLFPNLK